MLTSGRPITRRGCIRQETQDATAPAGRRSEKAAWPTRGPGDPRPRALRLPRAWAAASGSGPGPFPRERGGAVAPTATATRHCASGRPWSSYPTQSTLLLAVRVAVTPTKLLRRRPVTEDDVDQRQLRVRGHSFLDASRTEAEFRSTKAPQARRGLVMLAVAVDSSLWL